MGYILYITMQATNKQSEVKERSNTNTQLVLPLPDQFVHHAHTTSYS